MRNKNLIIEEVLDWRQRSIKV